MRTEVPNELSMVTILIGLNEMNKAYIYLIPHYI